MNRKLVIVTAVLILIGSIILNANVLLTKKSLRDYIYLEIENRGYTKEDIFEMIIDHSYTNRILGYNEWRISVEFNEVSDILFWFTYRDKNIIFQGVSSDPMIDKELVIYYSEKYKDGSLLQKENKLIEIIDLTVTDNIPTASALEKFYRDDEYVYYFPSIKSEYLKCHFEDGKIIPFMEAFKNGEVSLSDLDKNGIAYFIMDSDGNFIIQN